PAAPAAPLRLADDVAAGDRARFLTRQPEEARLLSLHVAHPICAVTATASRERFIMIDPCAWFWVQGDGTGTCRFFLTLTSVFRRSEEHTSELRSRENLVCRLLLERKKIKTKPLRRHRWRSHVGH